MKKSLSYLGKGFIILGITLGFLFLTLLITIKLICSNISTNAKELFATTMLETGQLKFLANLFISKEDLQALVEKNAMAQMDTEVDTNLIDTENEKETMDKSAITLEEISGNTFFAKMLIINDPARVKLATTYPWKEYGVELEKLVHDNNAIAGVNGGLYESTGNKGGKPLGIVVKDGKIEFNNPTGYPGLHLIGFDQENILRIISLEGKTASQVEQLVQEEKIRDAVAFQEENSDSNNHFVKLIINGEERGLGGKGSGANPRTAIGQRADGSVLLLVTDGRGANGHLGATAKDLIKIMKQYGAVNAANLDGGSSSSMYYNDKYEMSSVTFYYANSSWKLPTGFIVEKR